MAAHVVLLHHIPAEKLEEVKAKFRKLGATEIEEERENGTYTLRITFP